jgi:hypothetical protein
MKPFSELTGRGKLIEVLRWLGVLPAAVIADVATQFVGDAVVQIARNVGWNILGTSNFANALILFLFYLTPTSAFVIAGAKTAPRHQRATAIVLTLLGILFSLLTHVISQHFFAGRRLGIVNYLHLCTESAGLVAGAAYILSRRRRNINTNVIKC